MVCPWKNCVKDAPVLDTAPPRDLHGYHLTMSRLWHQQGKRQEAHELQAPVYGWFTEGFDTADLQEAKVLLEELT